MIFFILRRPYVFHLPVLLEHRQNYINDNSIDNIKRSNK